VDSGSDYHTVANAKGIYIDLLEYFRTRQDRLFVVIAAPPLSDPTYSSNARTFNEWLIHDWLAGYPYRNVFVFDFYNVLTTNGGNSDINDLDQVAGNHHRWWNNAIQHKIDGDDDSNPNVLEYPSGVDDDHPTTAGNLKATAEFLPLLNIAYNRWRNIIHSTSLPIGLVHTDVVNAPAGSVVYVLPDWQSGSGHVKPSGVSTAALSDFTALGFMFGASTNTQIMALDTNSTYFDPATGAPKMSSGVLVVFAGRAVNGVVHYYEMTEMASPIYADYAMIGGVESYAYFDRQGNVVASLPASAGQAGTSDMFLVEYFKDANNNKVFIVYGFAWKGTYVGGVFFKTYLLPNITSFTHGWYIYQWNDTNGNGLPDPYEVITTPVNYGD